MADFPEQSTGSWKQYLDLYQEEKTKLPPVQQVRKPLKTISQLNPVLQRYKDSNQQTKWEKENAKSESISRKEGREMSLRRQANYDLIKHTSHVTGNPVFEDLLPTAGVRARDFDILSTKRIDRKGNYLNTKPAPVKIPLSEKSKREIREFNVLKNRYEKDHERKISEDNSRQKKIKTEQYFRDRDFDLVKIKYVDPNKEHSVSNQEHSKEKIHFEKAKEARLQWHKFSEGACEDILTGEPVSKNKPFCDAIRQRHLRTYLTGYKQRDQWNKQSLKDQEFQKDIIINRKTSHRYVSGASMEKNSLGFNIINNRPWVGRTGLKPPKPLAHDAESIWKFVQNQKRKEPLRTCTAQLRRIEVFDNKKSYWCS